MTTCEDSYYQRASEKASAALQNGSLSGRCTPELIPSSKHTEVFDSIGSPIFAVDKAGAISEWNRKLSALSGLSLSDVVRKPASLFIVDGFRPQWEGCLSQVLKGQATECACEVSLFLSQGNNTRSSVLCRVRIAAQYDAAELPLELQSAAGAVCFIDGFQGQPAVASDDACADSTSSVTLDDELEGGIGALSLDATNGELAALLDTLRTPFFGIDAAGKVDAWNDRMSEATGYVQHEALGNAFVESFVDSYRREAVSSVFARALEENGANNFELEFRGKDGELRFLLVNLCARLDDRRKPVGVVGVAQDVTEVSKHDRAVAAMASELRQLIDTANAPIFGIDCEGDVNEWNNTTAEITGYTKEEAFDCNLVDTFVLPSMRETVRGMFECALQGRGTSNFEIEFVTKSNEVRNLLVNATTRRDTEDCVVGVVAVAQDVTEAVQRDRAVAAMALELRQLIDTANAPIFGIDVNGNVNEWNRRTQEITGYSKEETFDEPLVERFIAPSMRQTVQRILDQALQGNETSNYELEFVTKSGESRFMLVNATTRRDPEFNIIGVVGVGQDVTEDRKHAAELRKMQYLQATQEAKVETERNMTAYFAHELRNPLSAIDSALNAMPDDLPSSVKSLITGMRLCIGFMSAIMNNLLDVRKMEEGKMTLNFVPMSLESLIAGVHKMLLPSVKPGVKFTTTVDVGCRDWVLGDQHRIQQVLTNVVTNSIKYTVSGSIELRLSWEGGSVKFECIDTGPGIPKSEQAKLFQRFVQRGGAPGTGLGLAIAKHLVDLHNGFIKFESDPTIMAGTTCIVVIPLSLCDPPDQTIDESVSLIEYPLKFLIVDDVKMNRIMLQRRLKKGIAPNCSIVEACTGEEALEMCGNEIFDVIIVDQYMEEAGGVMVGTDVVYALRRMRIDSIIIGCSGNDLDREFKEAGANWVWKKPMPSNSEILAHLREALGIKCL